MQASNEAFSNDQKRMKWYDVVFVVLAIGGTMLSRYRYDGNVYRDQYCNPRGAWLLNYFVYQQEDFLLWQRNEQRESGVELGYCDVQPEEEIPPECMNKLIAYELNKIILRERWIEMKFRVERQICCKMRYSDCEEAIRKVNKRVESA